MDGTKIVVAVKMEKDDKVIASDGCYSMVRRQMESKKVKGFRSVVNPWTFEFRVLFAETGKVFEHLDQKVHYIMVK